MLLAAHGNVVLGRQRYGEDLEEASNELMLVDDDEVKQFRFCKDENK